jgi:hypothetical protein
MELIIQIVMQNGLPRVVHLDQIQKLPVLDLRVFIIASISIIGIVLGTWGGFPVFDDASLILLWNAKTPGSLFAANLHRPIVGWVLQFFVDAFQFNKLPYVLINIAFWLTLSWQTFLLSRRLFSEYATAALAAMFVLAPIVVRTHYTTITTLFPANLPVSICMMVLLLCLKQNADILILLTASFLGALASAMSEYGVAISAASIALLFVMRKNRAACALLIGSVIGYLIFQSTSVEYRASRTLETQIQTLGSSPLSMITHLLHSLWTALIGAYGGAAKNIALDADTRSTLLAALIGIAAAALILQSFRKSREIITNKKREMFAIILGVVAGLLPVILANQAPSAGDTYETRFFIPILPFAAIVTARMILYLIKAELRPIVVAVLAFITICTVFNGAFQVRREQKSMEGFAKILKPIVEKSSELTVVVVPDFEKLDGADITPKIIFNWPPEIWSKVWILTMREIVPLNGPRTHCNSTKFNLPQRFLSVKRSGPISNLYFVPEFWHPKDQISIASFEPYCIKEVTKYEPSN